MKIINRKENIVSIDYEALSAYLIQFSKKLDKLNVKNCLDVESPDYELCMKLMNRNEVNKELVSVGLPGIDSWKKGNSHYKSYSKFDADIMSPDKLKAMGWLPEHAVYTADYVLRDYMSNLINLVSFCTTLRKNDEVSMVNACNNNTLICINANSIIDKHNDRVFIDTASLDCCIDVLQHKLLYLEAENCYNTSSLYYDDCMEMVTRNSINEELASLGLPLIPPYDDYNSYAPDDVHFDTDMEYGLVDEVNAEEALDTWGDIVGCTDFAINEYIDNLKNLLLFCEKIRETDE